MTTQIQRFFQQHFDNPNYLYFLISLLMMLVLPALSSLVPFGELLLEFTFGMVIIMACVYVSNNYRDLIGMGVIGAVLFILFIFNLELHLVSILLPLFTFLFFGFIFVRLIQCIFQQKSIALNDIYALCSAYLILGIIAAPFFFMLDMKVENAFSISNSVDFYDLLYFSYITLTGVGYGDITPVHPVAKSLAMVLGILGQLYLAILVGIIIGKFLSREESPDSF